MSERTEDASFVCSELPVPEKYITCLKSPGSLPFRSKVQTELSELSSHREIDVGGIENESKEAPKPLLLTESVDPNVTAQLVGRAVLVTT